MWKSCWTSLAVCVWLGVCCSLFGASSKPGFSVDVFDSRKGLPQSVVFTLTQTRDGYLWVGTLEGLARFDGARFVTFDEANTPGLDSSRILKLFEDSQTNLWIGTESGGVYLARTGQVSRVELQPGLSEGRLTSIAEDSKGSVWLYTTDGRLARAREGKIDQWMLQPGFGGDVRPMAVDGFGFLWVGTDRVLYGLNTGGSSGSEELPPYMQLPMLKLDYLLSGRDGSHWRLANGFIQQFRGTTLVRETAYPWSTTVGVATACEDLQGNLIVGTFGDGVYWSDGKGGFAHIADELSHKSVLAVIVDREGCLWVGTNGGGLNRVRRQLFEVLPASQGFTVQSVCEDTNGGLWIGYNGERIDYWSGEDFRQFTTLDGERLALTLPPYVKSVFSDSSGQLFSGVWNRGLLQFTNNQFVVAPGTERLPRDVSVLFEDRCKRLWVGTQAGLVMRDESGWTVITNRLASSVIRAIAEDREGAIWVGTEGGGLHQLQGGQIRNFTRQEGLPSNNIRSLYCDTQNVLWVGTSSGLARFENGHCASFAGRLGQARGGIGYLLEDKSGFLWMGTAAGLLRASKHELHAAATNSASVMTRSFGEPDGLPSSECSQGSQPAACRSRDGRLWFPTIQGLVSVNPQSIVSNTNPPPVIVESVLVDSLLQHSAVLRTPTPASITVPAGRESLEIQYTSLNFSAPDKGLFRYILHGHETVWTERSTVTRSARYTRLPHGSYRFQVIACNEDGVWNDTGASLAVTVLPPFWQTWWFITLTTLLLLGLIVGSASYVSTQRLQRQLAALRQKEALERERARIARDLHDQLGANLTQVALLGEMAETDKELPEEVESHARQICQTARETTHALDEIVWTVNPSNDTLDGLVNYVCKYAQDYLAMAGLKYRLEVPSELPNTPISPELRHNLFLAAKEAINNVVKHAQASAAHVRLELSSDHFILEIEDNGKGISAADDGKGRNGLRNMRKRMEEVGGKFELAPGSEGGTRVRLVAPLRSGPNERATRPLV